MKNTPNNMENNKERPTLGPEAQQILDRIAVEGLTNYSTLAERLVPIKTASNKPIEAKYRIPTLATILGVVSMVIGTATTGVIIYVTIHFMAKHW